jgi:hypothetical protein
MSEDDNFEKLDAAAEAALKRAPLACRQGRLDLKQ